MQLAPPFFFLDPGELCEGDLKLVLRETVLQMANRPPAYRSRCGGCPIDARVGRIELRVGTTQDLVMYAGTSVTASIPRTAGHRYAAQEQQAAGGLRAAPWIGGNLDYLRPGESLLAPELRTHGRDLRGDRAAAGAPHHV